MMRSKIILGFAYATLGLLGAKAFSQAPSPSTSEVQAYESNRIFFKIRQESDLSLPKIENGDWEKLFSIAPDLGQMLAGNAAWSLSPAFHSKGIHLDKIYQATLLDPSQRDQLLQQLASLSFLEYAEKIPVYSMDLTPNDMGVQVWHLPKIQAEEAWDLGQGKSSVVIAVVDDAIQIDHEDLQGILWTNPGEIDGDSIDNDGNGFIDDIHGFDAADEDPDPSPPNVSNTYSHGTHTSGLACAATDNGIGVASISFNVSLMAVKTKHDSTVGTPYLDNTMGGIDYAISAGADIVSMSFGGSGYSATYAYLIQQGYYQGMLFVAAAGNDGQYKVYYPAAYDYVVSVGSTDFDDRKSGFSNYHPSVDVMAPGNFIYSTVPGGATGSYNFMSGTSMATPIVSGLAGLLLSADSTLDPDQLTACLKNGCVDISSLNPGIENWIGAGRINALNSMNCVLFPAGRSEMVDDHFFRLLPVLPNPASESAQLQAETQTGGFLSLRIRDLHGREIDKLWEGPVGPGRVQFSWNGIAHAASGMYFAEWIFEGRPVSQKFLIKD